MIKLFTRLALLSIMMLGAISGLKAQQALIDAVTELSQRDGVNATSTVKRDPVSHDLISKTLTVWITTQADWEKLKKLMVQESSKAESYQVVNNVTYTAKFEEGQQNISVTLMKQGSNKKPILPLIAAEEPKDAEGMIVVKITSR